MAFRLQMTGLNEGFDIGLDGNEEFAISPSAVIEVVQGEVYEGEYEIVPGCNCDIVIETKDKTMMDNLKVDKIPFESVSNPEGGNTVTIGGY